jgi:uncharacterized protein
VETPSRESASGFESFHDAPYCLLVTFRRTGLPVPTSVCFGIDDGTLYVRSEGNLGKVKRIRNNPTVQIAPCRRQGAPLDSAIEGRARLITDKREQRQAENAIQRHYGLVRLIYRTIAPPMRVHPVYLAVTAETGGTLSSIPESARPLPAGAPRHGG